MKYEITDEKPFNEQFDALETLIKAYQLPENDRIGIWVGPQFSKQVGEEILSISIDMERDSLRKQELKGMLCYWRQNADQIIEDCYLGIEIQSMEEQFPELEDQDYKLNPDDYKLPPEMEADLPYMDILKKIKEEEENENK